MVEHRPQLIEQRAPGHPMRPVNVKLPADVVDQLHRQAERLHCYPSALGRALIARGLADLAAAEQDGRPPADKKGTWGGVPSRR